MEICIVFNGKVVSIEKKTQLVISISSLADGYRKEDRRGDNCLQYYILLLHSISSPHTIPYSVYQLSISCLQ